MAEQAVKEEAVMVRRTYVHEPHVEAQIAEFTSRGLSWAVEQTLKRGIGWRNQVHPEVTVHLIRLSVASKKQEFVDQLVHALWEFSYWNLERLMERYASDVRGGLREEVTDTVLMECFQAWLSSAPSDHFWEIRFSVPLQRVLSVEVRKARKQREWQADQFVMNSDGLEVNLVEQQHAPGTDPLVSMAVWNALNAMNEGWARAFVLCRLEGYSDIEAAQVLGVSDRTVRNYIQHAVNALRQTLLPGEPDK